MKACDPVAVRDHVQRQDHDEQQVADRAEARDGELLERLDELAAYSLMLSRNAVACVCRSTFAKPERVQALLPRREDLGQVRAQRRQVADEVLERANSAAATTIVMTTSPPNRIR